MQMLLRLLKRIVDFAPNKMSLVNVAMIMAPNLFCVKQKSQKNRMPSIAEVDVLLATGNANVIRMLIKYQDILWMVRTGYLCFATACSNRVTIDVCRFPPS